MTPRQPPQATRPRLALFDLDHTLLPIDSDYEWGEFTIRLGWCDRDDFGRCNEAFYADYQAGRLDVHDYVRFATQAMRSQGPQAAAQAHAQFMREVIDPAVRPSALALLQKHRDQGDLMLIITATNEFVTRPIARLLGVDHLIAIELERDSASRYTGEIRGIPSMREGKVQRLKQWLAERDLTLEGIESTFYSDSMNDLPLLELVSHPVATNPDTRLRALARERHWPTLDLFDPAP